MRPGVDELVVRVEERPKARGEGVELASVATAYVGVNLHPGGYIIPVEDVLHWYERVCRCREGVSFGGWSSRRE